MSEIDLRSLKEVFTDRDWAVSWSGTVLFAWCFGLYRGFLGFSLARTTYQGLEGALAGSIAATLISAVVGALVFPSVASALWVICLLNRIKLFDRAMAGAITGFICTSVFPSSWLDHVAAAALGATGACMPILLRKSQSNGDGTQMTAGVQYTIRGLLFRPVVAAALIFTWKCLIDLFNNPQKW